MRSYGIVPSELEAFVRAWRNEVVPLRRRLGFEVVGAWIDPDRSEFIWVVSYTGGGGLKVGDREYASVRERTVFKDDPAAYVMTQDVRQLSPILVA
jgi:hypothetical protein